MEYFELFRSYDEDFGIVAIPELDPDEIGFLEGKRIDWLPPDVMVFEVDYPAKSTPAHFLGAEIPVVSDRFVRVLREAGVDKFQVFPARLVNPSTGKVWDNYFAFNVIGVLDVVDQEASSAEVIMDGDEDETVPELVAYDDLVLARNKIPGNTLMFRELRSGKLIVALPLAQLLADNKPDRGWGIILDDLETAE